MHTMNKPTMEHLTRAAIIWVQNQLSTIVLTKCRAADINPYKFNSLDTVHIYIETYQPLYSK